MDLYNGALRVKCIWCVSTQSPGEVAANFGAEYFGCGDF